MTAMLTTRFPLKRLTAVWLPVTFLWLFVACVSHCSSECADEHECHTDLSSFEITGAPDSDTCPITQALKATIPERKALDLQTTPVVQRSVHAVEPLSLINAFSSRPDESSFSSPPLERLPTLRI